jgi:hypothetical protein
MNPQPGAERSRADYGTAFTPIAREHRGSVDGQPATSAWVADVAWGLPGERADAMLASLGRLTVGEWRRVLRNAHEARVDGSAYAAEWENARRALPAALDALDDRAMFATVQRRVGEIVQRLPLVSQATRAHALLLGLYAVGAELVGPLLAPQHRSTLTRFFPMPGA